jgi:DNA-binding transcriptional LysR family regulator
MKHTGVRRLWGAGNNSGRKMQKRSLTGAGGRWDDLRLLLAAARSGRFTLAAKTLRVAETTVGRRLRALEGRIGTKLFDRRIDGVTLTPAGRSALGDIEAMEEAAARVERTLSGVDQRLSGVIRVTTTEGLGSYWLTPRLGEFRARYPDIRVDIITTNEALDLGSRAADIAIRYARPLHNNLVGLKVGRVSFDLVCSKEYAAQYGLPNSLDGLHRHTLIDHEPYRTIPLWRAILEMNPNVVYESNSTIAVVQAIRSGIGIGLIPRFARLLVGDLIVLNLELDCSLEVWLISHRDTNRAARTQAMWAYLKDWFQRDKEEWFS